MAITMTFLIYDKTDDSPEDFWTTERLKEEFFLCLANAKEKIYNEEGKAVTVRKYYAQARYKMPLIPVAVHLHSPLLDLFLRFNPQDTGGFYRIL